MTREELQFDAFRFRKAIEKSFIKILELTASESMESIMIVY